MQIFTFYYRLYINRSQKHSAIGEIERFSNLWGRFFFFISLHLNAIFSFTVRFYRVFFEYFFLLDRQLSGIKWNKRERERETDGNVKIHYTKMKFIIFNKLFMESHRKAFDENGGNSSVNTFYFLSSCSPSLEMMTVD